MKRSGFLFLIIFGLTTLACSLSSGIPFIGGAAGDISEEDVAAAATRAAEVANQAGELAATAVTEGDSTFATAVAQSEETVATPTPDPSLSSLEQKLNNIQPDANGNFILLITEDDLNEFISGQEGGGFQGADFGIEEVRIDINADAAELTGNLINPLQAPLRVQLRPVISNGQLEFEIQSATLGGFPMPASMLDLLNTVVNSEIGKALLSIPSHVTLQEAAISEGLLTIMGHQG